jgi:hypothetical protein
VTGFLDPSGQGGLNIAGVSGLPDPTTTPPTNPQDYSIAEGVGGLFLLVPGTITVDSPATTRR